MTLKTTEIFIVVSQFSVFHNHSNSILRILYTNTSNFHLIKTKWFLKLWNDTFFIPVRLLSDRYKKRDGKMLIYVKYFNENNYANFNLENNYQMLCM